MAVTLDEAISHCYEVYHERDDMCKECREEHRQLAQWLEELKQLKTADVVEVKRGKWIVKKGQSYLVHPMKYDENGELMLQDYISYECPFCGRRFSRKEPYCNCGARMDGTPKERGEEK